MSERNSALEDQVKIAMYNEFHKKHKKLFEKDRMQYWQDCNQYMNTFYHVRLAQAMKNQIGSRDVQTR